MGKNPNEFVYDPLILELLKKLEQTSSPIEYMRMLSTFHHQMIAEGVKQVEPDTIGDFAKFEIFWGFDLKPEQLIRRYEECFPNGPDFRRRIAKCDAPKQDRSALECSVFGQKLNQAWKTLGPHEFMRDFKDYHWHLLGKGIFDATIPQLVSIIQFEKSAGFPLDHEDIVKAYRKAQFGFVKARIEGNERLSQEFKKELFEYARGDKTPTGKAAITIEPDWENRWAQYDGLSFPQIKQKKLLPLYWYIHGTEIEFDAVYKGVALMEDKKVLYYDRYPTGGGPFKVNDFTDADFRHRSEIVAENIEIAVRKAYEDNHLLAAHTDVF